MLDSYFEFPLRRLVLIICILAIKDFFSRVEVIGGGYILAKAELIVVCDGFVLLGDLHGAWK